MGSVVVVFPASICAEMPMFRYLSMGVLRATILTRIPLEPVVGERLVGVRHAVYFLAFLHCAAAALGGLLQLAGQAHGHGFLAALLRRLADPAHRQRHAPHPGGFPPAPAGGWGGRARASPHHPPL